MGALPRVQDVSALLHDLYASVTDDTGLGRFLARTCAMLDASLASISLSNLETGDWHQVDQFPADAEMVAYETDYSSDDPIKAELLRCAPHRFYTALDLARALAPDARARWHRWFTGIGYCDGAAAYFPVDEHYNCVFGLVRRRTASALVQADTALLDLLLPHIAQALSIHAGIGRLRIMADIAQEQFAQMHAGCITLNEDHRVSFINPVAREMLRTANGLLLHDGALRLSDADAGRAFPASVEDVHHHLAPADRDERQRAGRTTRRELTAEPGGGAVSKQHALAHGDHAGKPRDRGALRSGAPARGADRSAARALRLERVRSDGVLADRQWRIARRDRRSRAAQQGNRAFAAQAGVCEDRSQTPGGADAAGADRAGCHRWHAS